MSFFKNIFNSSDEDQGDLGMKWNLLTDLNQLNSIVDESAEKPVVIFKHSTRCSVSRMALRQFENEFDMEDKMSTYFLDLLEYRSISNEISNRFAVEHQSPQCLLIRNGKSVYDASHSDIALEDLKRFI